MMRLCSIAELAARGSIVARCGDRPVVLFYNDGHPVAVDNRCPHMGFPLHRGTCDAGIITCHWHHARFDAATGGAFDFFAGDVDPYDVKIENGDVFVSTHPRAGDLRLRHRRRLREGMERASNLMIAKALLALRSADTPPQQIVREAVLFGVENRDDWANGLTILAAMANLLPDLAEETSLLALLHGISNVAANAQNQARRRLRYPLEDSPRSPDDLRDLFRSWNQKRHRDAAERTLLTAIANGATQTQLASLIFSAATDRIYAMRGHLVDFCNKAFETLDLIGWENAAAVLPSLIGPLVSSRGEEELDAWRSPIDLTELIRSAEARTPAALNSGLGQHWNSDESSLARQILSDDARSILDAILSAWGDGASLPRTGKALCYAAALRLARFANSNEFGDWITALHTFSYCNAIHQAITRCPNDASLARGLLHGAISVYQDRFLNVPPAKLPSDSSDTPDLPSPAMPRDLLDALDRQQQTDHAGQLVSRYLQRGCDPQPLLDTLARCVLREDADFHTYQVLEAGIRQYRQWNGGIEGTHILIGVARYLAAHSPTQRSLTQTANIALRLHRGEKIYDDESPA